MTRDAVYQPLDRESVARYAAHESVTFDEAAIRLGQQREAFLKSIADNPYQNGYVPPIWIVAKALLRGVPVSRQEIDIVRDETGLVWPDFAEKLRHALGFERPVNELLIMGANRSGKTDFAARTSLQLAMVGRKLLKIGFQEVKTGKEVQMKRIWHYMPNKLKEANIALKKAKDIHEHISYSEANGFAGSQIVMRNGSNIQFVTYKMTVTAALEGMEHDFIWLDEESPKSFLDAARGRIASRAGSLLLTFTPVSGYTPVVADFLANMTVTRWHTAYMLPRDNGPAMPHLELGLTEDEYRRLMEWRGGDGADPCVPEARPEDCLKWILGGDCDALDETARGRVFARTPRVAVCKGGAAAAIWFYGSDNPYGTPSEVIANAAKNRNAVGEIKKRVYGIAERIKGRLMPEFSKERNVVADADVPRRLARIMVVDPAPDRNWTAGWYGYDPATDTLYKYREWPSAYEIPSVGVPGPWAVPSDRRNGVNDGDKGDAQESFGMGFLHYKFEWARLEGWKDYEEWAARKGLAAGECPSDWPEDLEEVVAEWSELSGTRETILKRVIDSRAAASRKTTAGENVTLFEIASRLAENFEPASGQGIEVGLNCIRDRVNSGRFKVAASCVNTIFTWEHYCGADGQKGACKDFADTDRYAHLSGVTEYEARDATEPGEKAAKTVPTGGGRRLKRAGGL